MHGYCSFTLLTANLFLQLRGPGGDRPRGEPERPEDGQLRDRQVKGHTL